MTNQHTCAHYDKLKMRPLFKTGPQCLLGLCHCRIKFVHGSDFTQFLKCQASQIQNFCNTTLAHAGKARVTDLENLIREPSPPASTSQHKRRHTLTLPKPRSTIFFPFMIILFHSSTGYTSCSCSLSTHSIHHYSQLLISLI